MLTSVGFFFFEGRPMRYTKPLLTFEEQADLLIERGMTADRSTLVNRLRVVNYYRLSAYWHVFRNPDDFFRPGTDFESVWMRYVFDRRMRIGVMDAIERVEVAVRTQLVYHHSHLFGNPFSYADDPMALPGLTLVEQKKFLEQISKETIKSGEAFVRHFRSKYGDVHPCMPVWMATEVMTFGGLLTFYRGVPSDVQKSVATVFGVHHEVFLSWLNALNSIRNVCAHHGRLWNRVLGVKPKIPHRKNDPRWHHPIVVSNERLFCILTILKHCLDRIAPQSRWPERIFALWNEFRDIPLKDMGFPANWQDCPIWSLPVRVPLN
jgi:abortive infection bacteriophage resistance protein